MKTNRNYILVDKKPVEETNLLKWAQFMETGNQIVKQENIGDIRISTVFLGLNMGWYASIPILFETMIFGGKHSDYQERFATWDEALKGHEKALRLVQKEAVK